MKVSDIDVKFVNEKSDTLAEVRYVFNEKGITNRLVLNINMKNYNKMNLKDVSGYAGGYMLQRYFAKQVSDSFIWEIEFDNCKLNSAIGEKMLKSRIALTSNPAKYLCAIIQESREQIRRLIKFRSERQVC